MGKLSFNVCLCVWSLHCMSSVMAERILFNSGSWQTVRTHWRSCTLHLTASWFNSTKQADISAKKKKQKKNTYTTKDTEANQNNGECAMRYSCEKHSRVQSKTGPDCSLPNEDNRMLEISTKKGFQTSDMTLFKRLVLNSIIHHWWLSGLDLLFLCYICMMLAV